MMEIHTTSHTFTRSIWSIVTTEKAEPFALIGIACLSIYLILFVIFIPSNVTIAAKGTSSLLS